MGISNKKIREAEDDTHHNALDDAMSQTKTLLKILKELSKLSVDELHKITQEMEETLVHNFNRFLFDIKQETLDYLNFFILQNTPPSYPAKTFKLQVAGEKIKVQPHYKLNTQKYLI